MKNLMNGIMKMLKFVSAALVGLFALPAYAQLNLGVNEFGAQTALGSGGDGGLIGIISNLINIGLGFLGVLAVLYFLYGGFIWMTSGGEMEKVKKAKSTIVRAVIGLVIILSSWAITVFVIGAIGGATGANVVGTDNGGGGGGGGGFSGPGPDAFVVRGIAPNGNTPNQRVTVAIVTNKNIDPATAEGNVRIASIDTTGAVVAEIPGTIRVTNSTVEFTPAATCPDPNGTLNCFDPDADYRVTITTAVKSADNKNLDCGPLAPTCTATFRAGNMVDTTIPAGALTGPTDGMNFNAATGFTFQSQVTDDTQLARVEYEADGVLAVADAPGAPLTAWTSTAAWRPADATLGKVYRLSGTVFDTAGLSADLSGSVSVVARPNHCFNGVKDATETDVDCGGTPADQACGACVGGACTVNTDCASGTCIGGVCTAPPVIMNVNALDGAEGNMVTITGQNLATNGTVTFMGGAGADDDVTATLGCTGAWTQTSIIVMVPVGAKTGPIMVRTTAGLSDTTENNNGPRFTFTVNTTRRPGLCSMSPWTAATGDSVVIRGASLGTAAKLNIGSPALVSDVVPVDEREISFNVPSLPDAIYPITVTVGTETSNTLNFRVFTPPPPDPPLIESVTPASGPIGQYVTIKGSNFGNAGKVFFRLRSGTGPFGVGDVVFPQACGTANWQPNVVVVKVPATNDQSTAFATGNYTVSVLRSAGNALSNLKDFDVTSGAPSPGVCRMDPTAGPIGTPVAFYGDAFGTTKGTVAYTGATDVNPVEWAMGQLLSVVPGKQTVPPTTPAPAKATSGIVRVKSAANLESNPLFFTVGNCKETPGMCSAGEQCCDNGSCSTQACQIALPQQTYAWRFSTGKIPQLPKLLTQCDTQAGLVAPSPAPTAARAGGNQVCPNALVTAVFDHPLDASTISGAVKVWQCADETCAATTAVSGSFGPAVADGFIFTPGTPWAAGKTYLVEIKSSLKSLPPSPAIGGNAVVDPTCNRGASTDNAYCWKFTAGAASCDVKSLATSPSETTASEPYVASVPSTIKDFTGIPGADPGLCLAVTPPPGTTWSWTTSNATTASILSFAASLGRVAPHLETGANPVLVQPHVTPPNRPTVDGQAKLNITFARPQVVSYEPNCDGACSNAAILAKFNTGMIPSSVDMRFMLCSDSNCLPGQRVGNLVTGLVVTSGDGTPATGYKTFSVTPTNLQRSSYYRVLIPAQSGAGSNCKACSMSGISLAEQGTNFEIPSGPDAGKYFSWIFRVRNNETPCTVASIDVEPKQGSVELTGSDIIKYTATPRANPDSCSATGQALNAWGMNWSWSLSNTGKAGTFMNGTGASDTSLVKSGTNGPNGFVSGIATGFTAQCLKRGSDAVFGVTAKCGNGAWEKQLGEACDDGNVLPNDGCSPTCVLEGFNDHNNWTLHGVNGNCGDTRIQRDPVTGVGEECDDGNAGSTKCTATCKTTGVDTGVVCGNGSIEPYEGCDDGNTVSGDGCSAICLAEGSASNIVLCGDGTVSGTEECDNTNNANWDACNHQTCLWRGTTAPTCGNGAVNVGEQCDDANTSSGDGCSAACLREGSSERYANASFCGDATDGAGEAIGSAVSLANNPRDVTDPVQYVKRLATVLSPYNTDVRATVLGTTGTANFKVNVPGTQCVVPLSPSCTAQACAAVNGTCQQTVTGNECVVTNAPTCAACAAMGGSCVPAVPKLLVQCGASPVAVPSPAPFVVAGAMPGALATPNANACKNTVVSGQFSEAMNVTAGNPASVQTNLAMYDCGTGALGADCLSGASAVPGLAGMISVSDNDSAFHITPPGNAPWQAGHLYMVGVKGTVQSADGGSPDITQGIFSPDAAKCKARFGNDVYACWQFKVGAADCGPTSVSVGSFTMNPAVPLGTLPDYATALNQRASTVATAVNGTSCTEVGPFTYTWTSGTPATANFDPASPTTRNAVLKAVANGTTLVTALTAGISGSRTLTVDIAPTTCPSGQGPDNSTPAVCKPRPTFTAIPANMSGAEATDANGLGVARNAEIKITFNMPMEETTLKAAGNIALAYDGACVAAAGPSHLGWLDRMMESFHETFGILAAQASHAVDPSDLTNWCNVPVVFQNSDTAVAVADISYDNANRPTITVQPKAMMKALKWYRIKISKLVTSQDGVTVADVTANDPASYFHTGSKIAPVVAVQINDSDTMRPGFFTDPSQPSREFTAEAMGQMTQTGALFPIFPVEGVYAWHFGTGIRPSGWSPSNTSVGAVATISAIAKQTSTIAESPSVATVTVTKPDEFSDTGVIAATATITEQSLPVNEYADIAGRAVAVNDERTGLASITVFPCKNPWPSNAANFPWTDTAPGTSTNFSMFYCRDTGSPIMLPDLHVQNVSTTASGALKEYLFINSGVPNAKANTPSRMATLAVGGTGAPVIMQLGASQAGAGDLFYVWGTSPVMGLELELAGPQTYRLPIAPGFGTGYDYPHTPFGPNPNGYYAYYQVPTNAALGDYTLTWITPAPGNVRSAPFGTKLKIAAKPTITGFTPEAASVGDTVTINGTNLGVYASYAYVGMWNPMPPYDSQWTQAQYVDDTHVRFIVPPSASGSYQVYITGSVWTGWSTARLNIQSGPPKVTGTTPASGAPGTQMTISGSGFTSSGNLVTFSDGTSVTAAPGFGGSSLLVTVPQSMQERQYTYVVSNANGTSNQGSFRVSNAPTTLPSIDTVSPAFGPSETEVVLSGQNLFTPTTSSSRTTVYLTGSTVIAIDDSQMTPAAPGRPSHPRVQLGTENPPRLRVTIPGVVPKGTYKFRIVNDNGVSALSSGSFQMTDPQIVESPGAVASPTSDVIGVRVMPNPLHLNAMDWYRSKGYTGSPTPIEIDGYDAVIDDRTLYVAAANLVQPNVYTNIYIVSVNVGARADVAAIFEQIKKSLRFNHNIRRNLDNVNLCRTSAVLTAPLLTQNGEIVPCTEDATCSSINQTAVCASAKAKLIRDVKRVSDFRTVSEGVGGALQETSVVPALASGSFLRAFTTSKWPSWNSVFAQSIGEQGPAPVDPLNAFAGCTQFKYCAHAPQMMCTTDANCPMYANPGEATATHADVCTANLGYENSTCWNDTKQVFSCNPGSHVYTYRGMGSARALMGIVFETPSFASAIGRVGVCEKDSPNAGEACDISSALHKECRIKPDATDPTLPASFFNCVDAFASGVTNAPLSLDQSGTCTGTPIGATARCGDGVVSSPEVCEVGQVGSPSSCTIGNRSGTRTQTCNAGCDAWVQGSCVATKCGDGKIDTADGETCDDGANNGKYGYCSLQCNYQNTRSCGDSTVDPGEECDCGASNGTYGQTCANAGANGCSAQCRKGGPRCGDAVKQVQETCEIGEAQTDVNACDNNVAGHPTPCIDAATGRKWILKKTCGTQCNGWTEAWVKQGSCGDGTKDPGELCDDGNTKNEDACTNTCRLNTCGDGTLNTGIEECDDADRNGQACDAPYGGVCNYCTSICKLRTISGGICGNKKAEAGEKCDAGDYGGKYCLKGDSVGSSCSTDADCGGEANSCIAKFCLGGLKCTTYDGAQPNATTFSGTVLNSWIARSVDFTNDTDQRIFCSNDPRQLCRRDGQNFPCVNGGTCTDKPLENPVGPNAPSRNNFSVECTGFLTPKYSETYTFNLLSDDNARLYLNGRKLIDAWVGQSGGVARPASAVLEAGKRYPILIQHLENGGQEHLRLIWESISQSRQVIPWSAFTSAPDPTTGVCPATYISTCRPGGVHVGSYCTSNADCSDSPVMGTCGGTVLGAEPPSSKGMCLGGKTNGVSTDGSECWNNTMCGTGGTCSYVPGTCFNPTTRIEAGQCRSKSDCVGRDNNASECGAGVCNGGRDNGKICSADSQCADSAKCVFSKCNLTCNAFCPTEFQPVSLAFKTINQASKCVAGNINNVGGLCTKDSDCVKNKCTENAGCVGGTECQSDGVCRFPASYRTCSGGFVSPDGSCSMCLPAGSSTATANLGSYAFDNANVACVPRCKNNNGNGNVYGVACQGTGFTCPVGWGCEANHPSTCLGGPMDGQRCTGESQCRVQPDRAWLTIPQCRSISAMTADVTMPVDPGANENVYVVFITDVSSSMVAPGTCNVSNFNFEGSPWVPIDCDGDGSVNTPASAWSCSPTDRDDTRLLCATNNLFGKVLGTTTGMHTWDRSKLTSGSLDRLFEIDPQKMRVALMDFSASAQTYRQDSGSGTFDANLTNWVTYDQLAKAKRDVSERYDTMAHPAVGDTDKAFNLAKNMLNAVPVNSKKVVIILTDATDGDAGRASILAAAQNLKKDAGADLYAISYARNDAPHDQRWQLKSLSSDCAYSKKLPITLDYSSGSTTDFAESKKSMIPQQTNCLDLGFFTDALGGADLARAYDGILAGIRSSIKVGASGSGSTATTLATNGVERPLDTSFLSCNPVAIQNVPFYLNYAPQTDSTYRASVTNVKAMYCPVQ